MFWLLAGLAFGNLALHCELISNVSKSRAERLHDIGLLQCSCDGAIHDLRMLGCPAKVPVKSKPEPSATDGQ